MFADISGFTNLTEQLAKMGPEGSELIAFALNRYMESLVAAISRSGGDIFKFAGGRTPDFDPSSYSDAIIAVWPPSENLNYSKQDEELLYTCRQALQSAVDMQKKMNNLRILDNITLSVKIGFFPLLALILQVRNRGNQRGLRGRSFRKE